MRFEIFDLGLVDFQKAWDFQKETFRNVLNKQIDSALILCRHYPVITLGRSADRKNILISDEELKNRGISVYGIERGGDVTYHGPGQVTIYPVFNLEYFKKDIHWFLRKLENVAVHLLQNMGIQGECFPGLTGVWSGNRKIASIGIAIKNWITYHGLSINVSRHDLDNFTLIRPCGMDRKITSVETLLGRAVDINRIEKTITRSFIETFKEELHDQGSFTRIRRGDC